MADVMVKKGAGRPYPTHTKLGRLIADRGLRAVDVSRAANVYPRTLTDLLAGRKPPTNRTLVSLSTFLRVPPEAIVEDSYPCLPTNHGTHRNVAVGAGCVTSARTR